MKKQKTKGVVTNLGLRWCETSESRKCANSEDSSRPTARNLNLLHTHLVTVAFRVRAPSVFLIALIGHTLIPVLAIFFLPVC